MKSKISTLGLCAAAFPMIVGCSISYEVGGAFEDTGQTFRGRVIVSIGQSGTINVTSKDGAIICSGSSQVTNLPADTIVGAEGHAKATCNDGRSFKVNFVQTTEDGGVGEGLDDRGNIVSIVYSASHAGLDRAMKRAFPDAN